MSFWVVRQIFEALLGTRSFVKKKAKKQNKRLQNLCQIVLALTPNRQRNK